MLAPKFQKAAEAMQHVARVDSCIQLQSGLFIKLCKWNISCNEYIGNWGYLKYWMPTYKSYGHWGASPRERYQVPQATEFVEDWKALWGTAELGTFPPGFGLAVVLFPRSLFLTFRTRIFKSLPFENGWFAFWFYRDPQLTEDLES